MNEIEKNNPFTCNKVASIIEVFCDTWKKMCGLIMGLLL